MSVALDQSAWCRVAAVPILLCLFLFSLMVPSLSVSAEEAPSPVSDRVKIARSSPDYPVTPGDVYNLQFRNREGSVDTLVVAIQSDATATIGIVGTYNVEGVSFRAFRETVLRDFETAYPGSLPELTIMDVGEFLIGLSGAYITAQRPEVWGMTTVSEVVGRLDQTRVNTRSVTLVRGSASQSIDVQHASLSVEPQSFQYLRPGDQIILSSPPHMVSISGAVVRPGEFQVLPEETVRDAIQWFASGLSVDADVSRIQIRGKNIANGEIFVDYRSTDSHSADQVDEIFVPTRGALQPTVFLEGAIVPQDLTSDAPDQAEEYRYFQREVPWYPGETVGSLVARYRGWFSPNADLKNAILRSESEVTRTVDISSSSIESRADSPLAQGDRLMVPFRQPQVVVSGAVGRPGTFAFVPNRDYEYYLRLAGGIDGQRRIGRNPRIVGADGSQRSKSAPIEPGDTIHFNSNHPWYHVGPIFTVVSTVLSTYALILNLTN